MYKFEAANIFVLQKRIDHYSKFIKQLVAVFSVALLPLISFANEAVSNEAVPVAEDPVLEKRLINLSENLRCLVCQNESLAGSRADFANDLRREMREQMKANKSDEEIIEFLVARYGDFVLYNPPFKANTVLLWFGPLILFVGGTIGLIVYLRRRRTQLEDIPLSESQRLKAEALIKKINKE
ncbi:cytochrome c-type biogenesis protein [Nitrosomonas sp. Nm33]|uniref:cytochrome c-type biogenesis protein n=1 Tax=Nitrosomonas sp. Nm33 TaxID=133724 RepID=UPI00089B3CF2|nr:cytochrome c-type biogenesis protein [Nitrosomonas sp. Nm33]SDY63459.1 cytochrome c-type biogenesis protein CcmH [Nitrosomonas sp. Nm33]